MKKIAGTARFSVSEIIAGDAFTITYEDWEVCVRIYGIDAPDYGRKGFERSKAALASLVRGRRVRLEFPVTRIADTFGRLPCRVWVGDLDVGQEMVNAGSARAYQESRRALVDYEAMLEELRREQKSRQ